MSERITSGTLTAALIQNGVITADAAPLPSQPEDRPWFVSALQGIAGWLAGIFVLIFIGAAFEPHGTASFALFAMLLLAAAFGLYLSARGNTFLDQLALAVSIAGQISATVAFATASHESVSMSAAGVGLVQCALVILMPNYLARCMAAFFACVAWSLTIRFATSQHVVSLTPAVIGWAVIWIPVAVGCVIAIEEEARWMGQPAARIVRPALSGMLLALTVGTFASEPLDAFEWLWSSRTPTQNWLVLWPLLNAGAALLAGFGAFRLRNKALLGVAIAAALLHVGQFYFLLGASLLAKSAIMVAVGMLLLGWGFALGRRTTAQNGVAP